MLYEVITDFSVQVPQDVAIEFRGHTCRIVIGRDEPRGILHKVRPEDQGGDAGHLRQPAQQSRRLGFGKIADGRSVITSYSIHYTKLYEDILRSYRKDVFVVDPVLKIRERADRHAQFPAP